jgi:hypothetical protein
LRDVCRANKRSGESCRAPATEPDGYCWAHSPAHSAKRSRITSRAGRTKPSRELAELRSELRQLAEDVRSGELDPKVGTVINQICNSRLRLVELERAVREQDVLAAEIEELRELVS